MCCHYESQLYASRVSYVGGRTMKICDDPLMQIMVMIIHEVPYYVWENQLWYT